MSQTSGPITHLLARVSDGDEAALEQLFPMVYGQLRRQAEQALRSERPGHTLQPTALVHEAYLKLIGSGRIPSRDRGHFLSIAARAMRQILVDHARRRRANKRGKGEGTVPLDLEVADGGMAADEVLALDDALDRLSEVSPRLRSVVELRFFGGLGENEVAEALGVTARTVQRDWAKARAWLYREVYSDRGQGGDDG